MALGTFRQGRVPEQKLTHGQQLATVKCASHLGWPSSLIPWYACWDKFISWINWHFRPQEKSDKEVLTRDASRLVHRTHQLGTRWTEQEAFHWKRRCKDTSYTLHLALNSVCPAGVPGVHKSTRVNRTPLLLWSSVPLTIFFIFSIITRNYITIVCEAEAKLSLFGFLSGVLIS